MADINDLPEEILVHIFSYYVMTEKQCKLVKVLRKVCKTWENASKSSQLWKIFDGTVVYADFLKMCKLREFQNTREVIFSKTNALMEVRRCDLDIIFSNLPSLKRIDFSQVVKVKDLFFTCLQDQCPNLREIVFRKDYNNYRTVVSISKKIDDYLTLCGSKITHLNISHSSLSGVHKLFLVVSDSCPNLKELIAQHIEETSTDKKFPVGNVQRGCPKLKVLCLGWPMKYDENSWDPSNGFLELEVFTHNSFKPNIHNELFSNELLKKLLHLSLKLKVLDLRGCIGLTALDLLYLPARDLQKLYISDTWIFSYYDSLEFLKKWEHSLVKLDFSAFNCNLGLRTSVLNSFENLKSVKFSVHTDADIGNCYLNLLKNCSNLKSLEIHGRAKRRRLR